MSPAAGSGLAAVLPFTRPDRSVEETAGTPPDRVPSVGSMAEVLDAYAEQPDQVAALVEAWLLVLPQTAETRRYAAAILDALGELHVALDTAAHLTRSRCHCRTALDTRERP